MTSSPTTGARWSRCARGRSSSGARPKRTPVILGSVATISLLGFWLERNALVWPSLVPENGAAWAGPIQIGIALGFLGAFVLNFLIFSRVFPTLPLPKRS